MNMLAIAHRGASAYAPENTRAAFRRAIEMGADMIETDLQVTRDGVLVLIHDDLVDRPSDGTGPVADYTLAELRALDTGSWFGPEFAGERVLTLEEFAAGFLPEIPACLEITDPLAAAPAIQYLQDHAGTFAGCQVTSFSWGPAALAAASLDLPVGYLSRTFNEDIIARCVARGIAQICPHVAALTPGLVAAAHAAGLIVRAWGVKERSDIDRLFATGADSATTNWPDWITDHPDYRAPEAGYGRL
jgi:glycerophosphoryl diester phosphodiesterase